jgi:hypothetical protein
LLNIIAGTLSVGVTPSTSSYESIATVSVGSGGVSDVTFSSIPSTYTHLQVRLIGRTNRSDQNGDFFKTTLNSDTGSNYSWHFMRGNGTNTTTNAGASDNMMEVNRIPGSLITANIFGAIVIDILDYKNTNKYTTIRALGGFDGNGSGEIFVNSGLWQNTAAVTSITFTNSGGRTIQQYSSFALYGIKGV